MKLSNLINEDYRFTIPTKDELNLSIELIKIIEQTKKFGFERTLEIREKFVKHLIEV